MPRLIDADAIGIGKAKRELFEKPEYADGWNAAIEIIKNAKPIDAVPVVHGRWIDMQEDDFTEGMWRCSECGDDRYFEGFATPAEHGCNYCPNCGTKMDLEVDGDG